MKKCISIAHDLLRKVVLSSMVNLSELPDPRWIETERMWHSKKVIGIKYFIQILYNLIFLTKTLYSQIFKIEYKNQLETVRNDL